MEHEKVNKSTTIDDNCYFGEQDVVLKEIDIVFCRNDKQNCLFQIPLRPNHFHLSEKEIYSIKHKPNSNKFRIELEGFLSTANNNNEKHNKDEQFTKIIQSDKGFSYNNRYAVGKLIDNKLYLTSISNIYNFKPKFSQKLDVTNRAFKPKNSSSNNLTNQSQTGKIDINQINKIGENEQKKIISSVKIESEEARKKRMRSFNYLKKLEDTENWTNVQFVTRDIDQYHLLKNNLFSSISTSAASSSNNEVADNPDSSVMGISSKEYILNLTDDRDSKDLPVIKSLSSEKSLHLIVLQFLKRSCFEKCLNIYQIINSLKLVSENLSNSEILDSVNEAGLLFYNKRWICLSSDLYSPNSDLAQIRDFILVTAFFDGRIEFKENQLNNFDLNELGNHIKKLDIVQILETVAFMELPHSWCFSMPPTKPTKLDQQEMNETFQLEMINEQIITNQTNKWLQIIKSISHLLPYTVDFEIVKSRVAELYNS